MTATGTADSLAQAAAAVLMPNYGERTITLVNGEGARCHDADGNEYLDFLGGIAVNNVGHRHPKVVEAIKAQADELLHCSNAFLIEPQIRLAERLVAESGLKKVFFGNSGAEATEVAMKVSRKWGIANRGESATTILCFEGSFHGRTWGALSASWSKKVREGFGPPVPGYKFARFNDLLNVDQMWDDNICAVLVETVQGEGGINVAAPEFLQGLRERCTERGALLIVDEIQCGMGRTGRSFAYQHSNITPDLVPFAKAIGGGLPLGGLLAGSDCCDVLQPGSHGSTFGGNPVACAAGLAVCDIVFNSELQKRVGEMGCRLWGGLEELRQRFPNLIDHVRGLGLMIGCALKVPGAGLVAIGRKHGLLFNCASENVIRFLPPLNVMEAEVDEALEKFGRALEELAKDSKQA